MRELAVAEIRGGAARDEQVGEWRSLLAFAEDRGMAAAVREVRCAP